MQFSQGRVLIGQGTGSDGTTSMTFAAGSAGGRYTSDQINLANPQSAGFVANSPNYADRVQVDAEVTGPLYPEKISGYKLEPDNTGVNHLVFDEEQYKAHIKQEQEAAALAEAENRRRQSSCL